MTQRPYQELLARLRDTFPAPVSDRKHDAYFVFSILRALDQVDDLKSEVPLLGRPRTLDYAAAERAELSEEGRSVEEVARQLVGQLEGMPIWGVGGEFVGIRHRSIFGSREPGVPREVVAMA